MRKKPKPCLCDPAGNKAAVLEITGTGIAEPVLHRSPALHRNRPHCYAQFPLGWLLPPA